MLLDHLAVGRIDVLFAPLHAGLDAAVGQLFLHRLEGAADHLAPVAARGLGRLGEHLVAQRIKVRERQLLKLVVQRVEAQAIGDGGIDLHRLAGNPPPLRRRHCTERAHVVQPVRELDEDDAHVARHREQHLAEVLGLRDLGRLELDLVELRHPVDELRHRLAEGVRDLVLGNRRVLGDVVEQRRDQRLPVEVPVGEDLGDRQGMGNVRVSGLAHLAGVRGLREAVGLREARDILRLEVAEAVLLQTVDDGNCHSYPHCALKRGMVSRRCIGGATGP
jgi:hypothetical protein